MTVKQAVKLTRKQLYDQVKMGKAADSPAHRVLKSARPGQKNGERIGGYAYLLQNLSRVISPGRAFLDVLTVVGNVFKLAVHVALRLVVKVR